MVEQDIRQAAQVITAGGVIAYPTEAVFGLGCDPQNEAGVRRILALKNRDEDKGFILIAADLNALQPYLLPLSETLRERVLSTWPGAVTWALPAAAHTARWLRGAHDTLAVRVTAHPIAAALCRTLNSPIVSTSANLSGQAPARDARTVQQTLAHALDYILPGEVGNLSAPSEIRRAIDGKILRPGG